NSSNGSRGGRRRKSEDLPAGPAFSKCRDEVIRERHALRISRLGDERDFLTRIRAESTGDGGLLRARQAAGQVLLGLQSRESLQFRSLVRFCCLCFGVGDALRRRVSIAPEGFRLFPYLGEFSLA